MVNLFKVSYREEPEEFDFVSLFEGFITGDSRLYNEECKLILKRLLTKKIGWQHEKEWRVFLTDTDHKLYADIVSEIIIDERAVNSKNGKKLVALCRERGWGIRIRKNTSTKTKHLYEKMS